MINVVIGTLLKLNVSVTNIGVATFDASNIKARVDFFTTRSNVISINKEDMTRVDADNYIAYVPTATLTAGPLVAELVIQVPDEGSPIGVREEIRRQSTGVLLLEK